MREFARHSIMHGLGKQAYPQHQQQLPTHARTLSCPAQKSTTKYGNEHEAIAVYNMMMGVQKFCPIYTLCVGNAFGEAALLLSAGSPVRKDCVACRANGLENNEL